MEFPDLAALPGTYGVYEISLWVMEFLVLMLIAFEVVSGIRHRTREHKRQTFLNERVFELSKLLDEGLRKQSIVPDPTLTTDPRRISQWMDSVKAWTQEVDALLKPRSQRASAAFLLVTNAGEMDSMVYASAHYFVLTGELRECYQQFIVKLENLRRIIERPEAYF